MTNPDSARFLDEDELARLDELLAKAHPDQAMMLEEYDGFCAALACAPTQVPADECLAVVLGTSPGEALRALTESERSELLALLGRHRRAVARRMHESEAWNAVIGTDESGRALGDAWAIGFLCALELRPDDWALLDEDEVCEEALELILRFAMEAHANPAHEATPRAGDATVEHFADRPADHPAGAPAGAPANDRADRPADYPADHDRLEPIADDEREELVDLMLDGVAEIFERLAPERERALKPATIRRDALRTGRNDACPCGSGRKFKQCHGAG